MSGHFARLCFFIFFVVFALPHAGWPPGRPQSFDFGILVFSFSYTLSDGVWPFFAVVFRLFFFCRFRAPTGRLATWQASSFRLLDSRFLIFVQGFSIKVLMSAHRFHSDIHSRARILCKSAHIGKTMFSRCAFSYRDSL